MNKLIVALCATASFCAFADETAVVEPVVVEPVPVEQAPVVEEAPAPVEQQPVEQPAEAPAEQQPAEQQPVETTAEEETDTIFWGFGNYGIYSGYQLYGSLVNSEPTLQGYAEVNANLLFDDVNLGYLGVGVWSNSDLTDKRHAAYGKAFNEWDFNVHWGRTFWFDDDRTWGLDYRTSVVWYWYPHHRNSSFRSRNHTQKTHTTVDWNHSLALVNPFITPFIDIVHEYHESHATLLQFGAKRAFELSDNFTLTPMVVAVWRSHRYNWCFPTGFGAFRDGPGLATLKFEVDANYRLTDNFGLFAKVAYCSIIDHDLRHNIDHNLSGADYGDYKDFVWGGVGVTFNF